MHDWLGAAGREERVRAALLLLRMQVLPERASLNQGTTGVLCVACTHSTKRTRCLTTLVLRNSLNQIVLVHRFVDMCQGFKKFKVFVGL